MHNFNPIKDIENSQLILDNGEWPDFHHAEVGNLNIWQSDVHHNYEVFAGPIIDVSLKLYSLEQPYIIVLKFHECDSIRMEPFKYKATLHDLSFKYGSRGSDIDGEPLPPHITVSFEDAFGEALSFNCLNIQAVERKEVAAAA